MTYLEVYKTCVNLFLDNWVETEIEQEGIKLQVKDLNEFVRIQVFNDDSSNFSHGQIPNKLLTGHVAVEVYARRGEGVGRLLELTDICASIFDNVKMPSGLKFQAAQVVDHAQMITGETVTDPNWISKSVITRFKAPL